MKVENYTNFRTDDLRKLFIAGLKHRGVHTRGFKVVVKNGRWRHSGYAWYRARSCVVRIPTRAGFAEMLTVARVFEHEVLHCQGISHRQMRSDVHHCSQPVPWAEGLQLRTKEPKPKPTIEDRIQRRALKAYERVTLLEREIKRKMNLLKKWKRKVSYYKKKGLLSA